MQSCPRDLVHKSPEEREARRMAAVGDVVPPGCSTPLHWVLQTQDAWEAL